MEEDKMKASEGLADINKLYHIENKAKEQNLTYNEIRLLRQKEAYPIIREFEKWMEDVLNRIPEYDDGQKDIAELLPSKWQEARLGSTWSLVGATRMKSVRLAA